MATNLRTRPKPVERRCYLFQASGLTGVAHIVAGGGRFLCGGYINHVSAVETPDLPVCKKCRKVDRRIKAGRLRLGPEHVKCRRCARLKGPVGRDVGVAMAGVYCTSSDCDGFWEDPQSSDLWPGEVRK